MSTFRQRILVWVVGVALLGGVAGLAGAAPVSAQTPGPTLGFPFNLTYPFVGTFPQSPIFPVALSAPFVVLETNNPNNPTTVLTSISYPSNYTNVGLPVLVAAPGFRSTTYIAPIPLLPESIDGQFCTDKTSGIIWVPRGSPQAKGLKCGGAKSAP